MARPVRCAMLSPGLRLGGAERWLVSLIRHTDSALVRWQSVAISSAGGADESLCRELAQYTTLHTQTPQGPRHPFDQEYFRHVHPDWTRAVQAACAGADVMVAWGSVRDVGGWAQDVEIPSVIVSHTTEREPEPCGFGGITHLAAVSEAAAGYFDGRPGRDRYPEVRILYNGADLDRCAPRRGREIQRSLEWGVQPDEIAVGYLGRESAEKNFTALARAILVLDERFKAVYHSSPVGRQLSHDPELSELARKSRGRIVLRPPEPHVGDILAGLDVMALASHREAFSLSLVEAWLAGVPVVATPVGSLPELEARFGPMAIQVPLQPTAEQLAQGIREAIGPRGIAISERAMEVAYENFTCEAMAARWAEYLCEVAQGRRREHPALALLKWLPWRRAPQEGARTRPA